LNQNLTHDELSEDSLRKLVGRVDEHILLEAMNLEIKELEDKNNLFFKNYQPTTKQELFHALGNHCRFRLLLGANRSGKSYCGINEDAMHLTGNYSLSWKGYKYQYPPNMWVCGRTVQVVNESLIAPLFEGSFNKPPLIHPSLIIPHLSRKRDNMWAIRHASKGISRITFKNYSQDKQAFEASGVDFIHFDEAPPNYIFNECIPRLGHTEPHHYRMMINTQTPTLGLTEPLQYFLFTDEKDSNGNVTQIKNTPEVPHKSRVYIMYDIEEATHLSREEKDFLIESYPVYEREARTKGIPSIGTGLIYPILESTYRISPIEIPDHWPRVIGLDFGGTQSHTAASFWALDVDNKKKYMYGEHYSLGRTPQQNALELVERGANWIPVIYDTSGDAISLTDGQAIADLYRNAGIKNMYPADRSITAGLQTVLQAFQNYEIKVVSTCENFFSEIRMYAFGENNKPKKGHDHLMDTMRYVLMTGLPLAKSAMNKSWSSYYDKYKDRVPGW
jgi:phage terminase large subunit-like protein